MFTGPSLSHVLSGGRQSSPVPGSSGSASTGVNPALCGDFVRTLSSLSASGPLVRDDGAYIPGLKIKT